MRLRIAIAAVLVAMLFEFAFTPIEGVSAETRPGTFDCELDLTGPTDSFLISCADGNEELYKITWSYWTSKGALGRGFYVFNDCTPSCVSGAIHKFPAIVQLRQLRSYRGKAHLTHLLWWQIDARGKRIDHGYSGEIDLWKQFLSMH